MQLFASSLCAAAFMTYHVAVVAQQGDRICEEGMYGMAERQKFKICYNPAADTRPLIIYVWVSGWFVRFPEYVTADIDIRPYSAPDVRSFVDFICQSESANKYRIDCSRVVLVGYSNAGIASTLAAQSLRKLNGIRAVVNLAGQVQQPRNSKEKDCPSYILFVGEEDENFMKRSRAMVAHFDEHNVDFEFYSLPGVGHANLRQAKEFIIAKTRDFLLSRLAPGETPPSAPTPPAACSVSCEMRFGTCCANQRRSGKSSAQAYTTCKAFVENANPNSWWRKVAKCELQCAFTDSMLSQSTCHESLQICDSQYASKSTECPSDKGMLGRGQSDDDTFRCRGGFCTSLAARCNGIPNCGDGSDEEDCCDDAVAQCRRRPRLV